MRTSGDCTAHLYDRRLRPRFIFDSNRDSNAGQRWRTLATDALANFKPWTLVDNEDRGRRRWTASSLEQGNPRPPRADQRADRSGLAERKTVGFSLSVEEFELEGSILNAAPLADQLVEALINRSALALTVDVGSMGCACGRAIDKDAKPHRSGTFGWSHDQVDVTGMKAKGDTPVRLV